MPTLNWMGREKATKSVKEVVMKILREDKSLGKCCQCENAASTSSNGQLGNGNIGIGNTSTMVTFDNVLVHGDNLEALKALLPFYAGQVKCIYIDPPYNTGSAFEHYDDNLEHSTWLNMMYPRLKLLRDFMREDGSIWISIDDREGAYLRVICDEIFGRQNFVGNVAWQRTYSKRGDSQGIPVEVEHVLVYSKREGWQPKKLARTEEMDALYKNPDNDPRGPWASTDLAVKTYSADYDYPITTPSGRVVTPSKGRCWMTSKERMQQLILDNRIWFGPDGNGVPAIKRFLTELKYDGMAPTSILSC